MVLTQEEIDACRHAFLAFDKIWALFGGLLLVCTSFNADEVMQASKVVGLLTHASL